jgi:hypothetical protein
VVPSGDGAFESSQSFKETELPGADCLACEVAQSGERHVVRAIPRFGHRSEAFSFAITLEAEPSAFQLRDTGEVSREWCSPIGNCSARGLWSTSSPAIGNSSPLYFPALRKLGIRLPDFPPPTQIILENPDSHARFSGRNSCQNQIDGWTDREIDG